jgi:hypothetical protein
MRIKVAPNLPKPASGVSCLAHAYVHCMTDNPYFPSPTPSLSEVTAAAVALEATSAAVLTRAKGARQTRDVDLLALRIVLGRLAAYVQDIADLDPTNAPSIIESAGMDVKRFRGRPKPPLEAVHGDVSGSAKVLAKWAGDRAAYEWRCSTDQRSWTNAPQTLQSSTVIYGLTPKTEYFFQVRITTKDGAGDWGQLVSLVVL